MAAAQPCRARGPVPAGAARGSRRHRQPRRQPAHPRRRAGASRIVHADRDTGFGAGDRARARGLRRGADAAQRTARRGRRTGRVGLDAARRLRTRPGLPRGPAGRGPRSRRRRPCSAPRPAAGTSHGCCSRSGLTTDGAGHRHTGLERREVDQGQHDGVRDVLAVGSAGMLVRRDVWDELGGYDPRLPLFRDDLDFGWRANLAGHRVEVVTDAVVHHAQAAAAGHRRLAATRDFPRRIDRRNAMFTVLANASPLGLALGLPAARAGDRAAGAAVPADPPAAAGRRRARRLPAPRRRHRRPALGPPVQAPARSSSRGGRCVR